MSKRVKDGALRVLEIAAEIVGIVILILPFFRKRK